MDKIISLNNVTVSYLQNKRGIHSVKDFVLKGGFINPFYRKPVLQDITVELKRGESLGILGRNGSGKSTFLRTVAGIVKPDKGTVDVRGVISPLLALGAGIELELTGIENIRITLALSGQYNKKTIRKTIDSIMDFSELSLEELKRPAKSYSSGMLARLAFSTVMSSQPEILMIDEVLAVGDQGFQAKCLQRINEIINKGATILFVSHNPAEMKKICQKGICLENGRLISNSSIDDAILAYNDLFKQQAGS
jgi:ABC-type polysaccharide/polyol phosphate transport system ATPase subunit